MARSGLSRNIEPQLTELAESLSFQFVDVELVKEGASLYLRIYIDKPGGITLNDCESYHRKAMPIVDSVEYDFLEVCSPGLDRPLKKEKDFLSHIGSEVEVHLYKPRDGRKMYEGILSGFEDGTLHVTCDGQELLFALKEVSLCKPLIVITEEDLNDPQYQDGLPDDNT